MLTSDLDATREAPTLAEVAALAGVSPATASRVLNNSARVSPTARDQVHDAVLRLGYVRQRAARGAFHDRQTRCIAAVICESTPRLFADPYYGRVLDGAESVLSAHEIPLLLAFGDPAASLERYLRGRHVDGVLLLSPRGRHPLATALHSIGVPITMVGRPMGKDGFSYVDVDNRGGARRAVERLLAAGRTRIATIAGPPDMVGGVDRLVGYRDAMDAVEQPCGPVMYGDWTRASGVHAMSRLLDHRPNLDAVFAASDLMAMGALHALKRAGRRVPEDVAIIGFDDMPMSAYTDPPLTTVRQPVEELVVRRSG
jgi:DNA-binding LacI/PurR family transcriptional regulator